MGKRKNVIFVLLIINMIIFWTFLVHQLQYNIKADAVKSTGLSRRTQIFNFVHSSLWDENHSSYYSFRLNNGSLTEKGFRKYTSFNMWAVRAILQYSIVLDDNSTFYNFGEPALNFMLENSQNKSNGGFYHWVEENGSLPQTADSQFNNSIFQIATYQAWSLITLIEAYKFTQNTTYINVWGKQVADFLINNLWDNTYGGFYSSYNPFYDEIVEPQKYTWYQAWPALALMEYYEVSSNVSYLNYATDTINFMLDNLWVSSFGAFVDNATEEGIISPTARFTLVDQAGVILALSKNYDLTGNVTIYNNYIKPVINFVKNKLWSAFDRQFYSACELDGTNPSSLMHPSDLSIWLYALSIFLDSSFDASLEQFLIDSISHLNLFGWDSIEGAYIRDFMHDGAQLNSSKWTIEQVIPLFLYLRDLPTPNCYQFYIFLVIFITSTTILITLYYKSKKTTKLTRYRLQAKRNG